jgi:hypothetical protein
MVVPITCFAIGVVSAEGPGMREDRPGPAGHRATYDADRGQNSAFGEPDMAQRRNGPCWEGRASWTG